MDMSFSPEDQAFRAEVRQFLRDRLPEGLAAKGRLHQELTKAEYEEWHATLGERGWLAGNWPVEFGGAGWTAIQRHIFEEESALAHAPRVVPFGLAMLGPVLQKFGSKEQQDRFLPRILNGQDWWCQGYSEPGAGSDLASVKTTAVRDGDGYVLTGVKSQVPRGAEAELFVVGAVLEGRPALFLHTTRYRVGDGPLIEFEEAHSHAPRQFLHTPVDPELRALLLAARTLVLVDDEASTGNTFVNLAAACRRLNPGLERVHLATITNFMGSAATGLLDARFGMPTTCGALVEGEFSFAPGALPPDQGSAQRFEIDADRGASTATGDSPLRP